MTSVEIYSVAHVPEELVQLWMQHLRDFDAAHPGCHFEVIADAPNKTFSEMIEMLTVNPKLPVRAVWKRGP